MARPQWLFPAEAGMVWVSAPRFLVGQHLAILVIGWAATEANSPQPCHSPLPPRACRLAENGSLAAAG